MIYLHNTLKSAPIDRELLENLKDDIQLKKSVTNCVDSFF